MSLKGVLRRLEVAQGLLVGLSTGAVLFFLADRSPLVSFVGGLLFAVTWFLFGRVTGRIHWVYGEMLRLGEEVQHEALSLVARGVPNDQAVAHLTEMSRGWRETLLVAKRRLGSAENPGADRAHALVKEALRRTRWPHRLGAS